MTAIPGGLPMSAGAALRAVRRARARGTLARMGPGELWIGVLLVGAVVVLLAGVLRAHVAAPSAGRTLRGPAVTWLSALIGFALLARATSDPAARVPYGFGAPEVQLLLLAPISRAALERAATWRRALVVLACSVLVGLPVGLLLRAGAAGGARGGGAIAVIAAAVAPASVAWLLGAGALATAALGRWPRSVGRLCRIALGVSGIEALALAVFGGAPGVDPAGTLARVALGSSFLPGAWVWAGPLLVAGAGSVLAGIATWWPPPVDPGAIQHRGSVARLARFEVLRGDPRGMVLALRRLANEEARSRPWFRWAPRATGWRSAAAFHVVASARRWPATRLARVIEYAVLIEATSVLGLQGGGHRGSWWVAAVAGAGCFGLGVVALEAAADLLDHPDLADSLPGGGRRLFVGDVATAAIGVAVVLVPLLPLVSPTVFVAALAASVAGPVLALGLGPPSLSGMSRLLAGSPEAALPVVLGRYLIGPLVSVVALRLDARIGVLGIAVGCAAIVAWSTRRAVPGPR